MKKSRPTSHIIFALVVTICVIGAAFQFIANWRTILDAKPAEFSERTMLQALWHQYKMNYIEAGTYRSLDKQQNDITTSEGQSYSMLRSVWMDDKEMFDHTWKWTKDNIQRKEDHLIAWLFGERSDGSYGILMDQGGNNSASDADVDIALALLFASKRWNDNEYFGDAIVLIRAIWEREIVEIAGQPYLTANNIEKTIAKETIVLNPSYFAPYAYKVFATVDPEHDWLGVADTSYEVIAESMREPLDKQSSAGLPPDWVGIHRVTGELMAVPEPTSLTTNFSYDALRVPWRLALDWQWNKDPRAKQALSNMGFLADEWSDSKSISISYSHDGAKISELESPAMYGGVMGYFMVEDPRIAKEIYKKELEKLYDPNMSQWRQVQSYYDDNWAWFGMALYAGELTNLYAI